MTEELAETHIRQINEQVIQAQERAAAAATLREEIQVLKGVARSRREEVVAEVDSTGRLHNIRFRPEALDLDPDELAQLVLETVGEAQAHAGQQAMALFQQTFGDDPALHEQLQETFVTENPHRRRPHPFG